MRYFLSLLLALSTTFSLVAQTDSTTCTITLKAIDLSENMSRLSTKDDEIIFLIYQKTDSSATLKTPVYKTEFVLDSSHKEKIITLSLKNHRYIIFILERDDDRTMEQIDPVLRVYYQEIAVLYSKKDWPGLGKYLGDNDLLGYTELSLSDPEIEFKNRQSMDSYCYKLTIKRIE